MPLSGDTAESIANSVLPAVQISTRTGTALIRVDVPRSRIYFTHLGHADLQLHLRGVFDGRNEHVNRPEAGGFNHTLYLRRSLDVAHTSESTTEPFAWLKANVLFRKKRADLRIDNERLVRT